MEQVLEEIQVQKYLAYTDSGIEGIGVVPKHWKPLANKHIFSIKKTQVGKRSGNFLLLSLTLGGVIKRDMENPQGKFPAEFNTYQEVEKGDFIFCLFDVEETPRAVGLSDFDGMITGAYTVMEARKDLDKNYLYWFFLNIDTDKRLRPLYTGLRNIISKENFLAYKIFVPPSAEQTAIARFLDRKTALIDKAIAIKDKQIELLKERRQILIHNAITRGLNPNVKMKDSGVDWIGEVPEHWEALRLKYVIEIRMGYAFPSEKFGDTGIPVVRIGDISTEGKVDLSACPRLPDQFLRIASRFGLQKGDILMAMTGGTIGKIGVYDDDEYALLNQRVCAFSINQGFERDLLLCWMKSAYWNEYIVFKAYGGAQPNISDKDVLECQIVLPRSRQEQLRIVDFISRLDDKISTTIKIKKSEIEKLLEFKSTLINSAVTGKIKVC